MSDAANTKPIHPADWQGPFVLSLVCALVDGLKQMEKPGSARCNRLTRVEETAMRAIDFYPPAELTPDVCKMASEFFETVEREFQEVVKG